jgi:hypothetical protein
MFIVNARMRKYSIIIVRKLYSTLLCLGNDHIPSHQVVVQIYLMKLPEQQDMPGRGPIMTEKWMKLKGWQKWKDRGMTAFSDILSSWLTEE